MMECQWAKSPWTLMMSRNQIHLDQVTGVKDSDMTLPIDFKLTRVCWWSGCPTGRDMMLGSRPFSSAQRTPVFFGSLKY